MITKNLKHVKQFFDIVISVILTDLLGPKNIVVQNDSQKSIIIKIASFELLSQRFEFRAEKRFKSGSYKKALTIDIL